MPGFPVKSGETFLFIGDSVTACGRTREPDFITGGVPIAGAPYGTGYVRCFMDIVAAHHPGVAVNWINKGIDGDTVGELRARWDRDVLAVRPDWLSIMIGIGNCDREYQQPLGRAVAAYRADYTAILEQVSSFSPRLVLLDPFCAMTAEEARRERTDDRRPHWPSIVERLPAYLSVVEELSRRFKALHVRTHDLFAGQLRHRPFTYFGPEPVHPFVTGHLLVAIELYRIVSESGTES